jgi:hypothetical protein
MASKTAAGRTVAFPRAGDSASGFVVVSSTITASGRCRGSISVMFLLANFWESHLASDKALGELLGESLLKSYWASKLLGERVARQIT